MNCNCFMKIARMESVENHSAGRDASVKVQCLIEVEVKPYYLDEWRQEVRLSKRNFSTPYPVYMNYCPICGDKVKEKSTVFSARTGHGQGR